MFYVLHTITVVRFDSNSSNVVVVCAVFIAFEMICFVVILIF
jgi:hypothetical protein